MATTMPRSAALFGSPDTLALDWKGLYQEHGPRLRRIAERRVGPAQAEDVVQDAFMRAFRNRTSLDPSRPIGAWLSSITLYSSTDALRRRSVRPELVEEDGQEPAAGWTVEDEFENAVRRMGIEKAFDSLNHRQRRVLKHLEIDGWTQEEVAAHEQISTEAVKSLAARARRTFREAYSAFAENMGVFGGAVAGTAVLRVRSRIQRLQGLLGEHVGAISVAAATVTVVAIATVPTTRPMPTMADEGDVTAGDSAGAPDSPTSGLSMPSVVVEPNAVVVSYASPTGTQAQVDATQESGTASVQADAQIERQGQGASALITAGTEDQEGDRQLYGGIEIHDCTRDTASHVGCAAIDAVSEAPTGN